MRMRITMDAPDQIEVSELVEFIAAEIGQGDTEGTIHDGDEDGATLRWEMREMGDGVGIDRRQRLAAAALLLGFDLPQNMTTASHSMLEAAEVCPGLTTGEMAPMGQQGRRHALEMARELIERMLAELEARADVEPPLTLRLSRLPDDLDVRLQRMASDRGTTLEALVVEAVRRQVSGSAQ